MMIRLAGHPRDRLQSDLRAHRETFSLTDADYAGEVLKVSLNTYKKCLQSSSTTPLILKRQTFIALLANADLDPRRYGLSINVPSQASPFGGYRKDDYQFLCGRYFLYRRSFLTARHITRSVLEIRPSETKECLEFHELHFYVSESGVHDENRYSGDVYLNQERNVLSLPAFSKGQVRLTLLLTPQNPASKAKMKIRGAVLAFGIPRGHWQPTVSCVFVQGPIDDKHAPPKDLCKTIMAGSEEHAALSSELAHAEEHATVITPLMWFKAHDKNGSD